MRRHWTLLTWGMLLPAVVTAAPSGAPTSSAPADTGLTMRGGQEGTVFRSLTVEGEDRVRYEPDRPPLKMALNPTQAQGLSWGSARDVLDRTVPDFGAPLVAMSAREASPYLARPWLSRFASGAVARFRPQVKDVESWKLTIVNAKGEAVVTYQGRGEPPREIAWDGRSQGGAPVVPGLTYSYVLEAHDRAGNKRNFVGQGFRVSAYRLDTSEGPLLVFSARELGAADPTRAPAAQPGTPLILMESASWLNQREKTDRPVRVSAQARTLEEAQTLSANVARQLGPHLIGDPARVVAVGELDPDAPEGGTVRITSGR